MPYMRLLRSDFSCFYFHFQKENKHENINAKIWPQNSHTWDCRDSRTSSNQAASEILLYAGNNFQRLINGIFNIFLFYF